jgi:hypothetical protein
MFHPPPNAPPEALDALAAFLERQARHLREEAATARQKAQDALLARARRSQARTDFLRLGARLAVLQRRAGRQAAELQVADRYGVTVEVIRCAATLWRKEKAAREKTRRDRAIWLAAVRGEPQAAIAARFELTARRVRQVIAAAEAHQRRAAKSLTIFSADRPTT